MAVYRLFPAGDGALHEWTKIGASTNDWEELRKTAAGELEGGSPGKPSTTTGLEITAKKTSIFSLDSLTLGVGEKVIAAKLHLYAKSTANALSFGISGAEVSAAELMIVAAAEQWNVITLAKANAEKIGQTQLTAWATTGQAGGPFITDNKTNLQRAFSFYLELETESESGTKTQKLEASLSFAGALPRSALHALAASLSFSGFLPRVVRRPLTASLSFVGSLPRIVSHGLAASLSFAGTVGRNALAKLSASLSFAGALSPVRAGEFVKRFSASLTLSASQQRNVSSPLAASLTLVGTVGRNTSRRLSAGLTFAVTTGRTVSKPIAASLSFAVSLRRNAIHALRAGLSFTVGLVPSGGVKEVFAKIFGEPKRGYGRSPRRGRGRGPTTGEGKR